jgi:hypothetical protein
MISCQCITFGRPNLLEEAIESFHRQDWVGEKELVILNDHPEQTLVYTHPEVVVINVPRRFSTVGEKRNACVSLCQGDVVFPWDDDDISLPWRISLSMRGKESKRYFKADAAWLWNSGVITPEPRKNVYHAMGCWDKTLFQELNGYPHIQSGQDAAMESKFGTTNERSVTQLNPQELYYIYRFGGTGSPHLSGYGYGKGWEEIGKRRTERTGVIKLQPEWRSDYVQDVSEVI